MLKIKNTRRFKKDLKKYQNQLSVLVELDTVLKCLSRGGKLDVKYYDHPLTGNWINHRECHVKPDVLLIYLLGKETIYLERFGSHAELLK